MWTNRLIIHECFSLKNNKKNCQHKHKFDNGTINKLLVSRGSLLTTFLLEGFWLLFRSSSPDFFRLRRIFLHVWFYIWPAWIQLKPHKVLSLSLVIVCIQLLFPPHASQCPIRISILKSILAAAILLWDINIPVFCLPYLFSQTTLLPYILMLQL